MEWRRDPNADLLEESARNLVYTLLENYARFHDKHAKKMLSHALWLLSESECGGVGRKYETRYCSSEALNVKRTAATVRHDHVLTRQKAIEQLVKARDSQKRVDQILDKVFGCTVTIDQHRDLGRFDKEYEGWNRYREAGIAVIDRERGEQVRPWED